MSPLKRGFKQASPMTSPVGGVQGGTLLTLATDSVSKSLSKGAARTKFDMFGVVVTYVLGLSLDSNLVVASFTVEDLNTATSSAVNVSLCQQCCLR